MKKDIDKFFNFAINGVEVIKVKTCSKPGCDGPHHAKGLCKKHYQQRYDQRRDVQFKRRVRRILKSRTK